MSHDIDMSNNRANIAFLGSRNDIWHRLGQEMTEGMSTDEWLAAAGLNWEAIKVPAIASLNGAQFDHIDPAKRFVEVPNKVFIARNDTGAILGDGSEGYQPHQPREVMEYFERYTSVDSRFKMDCAGSLRGGSTIWATAVFQSPMTIGGDKHKARLLMSTTFDGSGSTRNKAVLERVVCANTLAVAFGERTPEIRTRHSTRFNADRVARELAAVVQAFDRFKVMGDAMADTEMARDKVSEFFKQILDIPFDAKADDISTRKMNQFRSLGQAYKTSVREGAADGSAWAALQAVTRYVDHDRLSGSDEAKYLSAEFGSGAAMKQQAVDLLMPLIKDRVPVLAA